MSSGVVRASQQMLRDAEELTDGIATEGDADPAAGVGRALPRHRCQAVPKSAACAAGILCMALLAITFMRGPLSTQTTVVESAAKTTSLHSWHDGLVIVRKTGCKNWDVDFAAPVGPETEQSCVELCKNSPGCVASNFQHTECPNPPQSFYAEDHHACYLMNEMCDEGPNECWDLWVLPESDRKNSSFGSIRKRGTGCKNIATISKGPPTLEFSEFECKLKCEKDLECQGILLIMQGGECSKKTADNQKGQMCQLIYGLCDEETGEAHACTDVTIKVTHVNDTDDIIKAQQDSGSLNMFHLSEKAAKDATTLKVSNESCFRTGDTLKLFHEQTDWEHKYTVTDTGPPLTIDPGLTKNYDYGTSVLRINYPYSAGYCGDWPKKA